MTKKDIIVQPYKAHDLVGFDISFSYHSRDWVLSVRHIKGITRVYYQVALDDTIEFLDKYTRACRIAYKLAKKLEETK